jgi:hypothetical protein
MQAVPRGVSLSAEVETTVSQINCPHCGEPTDNDQGRCRSCKKRIGIRNWSPLRRVQRALDVVVVLALLVLGWLGVSSLVSTALRATRTEAENHLAAIQAAELAYHEKWGTYVTLPYCPATPARRTSVEFTGPCAEQYRQIGWLADGPVRCRYWVELTADQASGEPDFMAWGECDGDGDGALRVYRASRATEVQLLTPDSVQ